MPSNIIIKRPVKICFISSHFASGGTERQITELIKGLVLKGYSVSLLLYQSEIVFYEELYNMDVTIIANKKKASKLKLVRWINNFLFLRSILKIESFDILHTFLFYNGALVRLIAPFKFKGKIVYSIRNSYENTSRIFYYLDILLNNLSVNVYNSKKSFDQLNGKKLRLNKKEQPCYL